MTNRPDDGSRSDIEGLGFDLDDDVWLARLRGQRDPLSFGKLGAYELLEVIGRGGQGLVYRARQPHTGRYVAIKRLSAGAFATPEMRARFDREIEATAALDHPNIVTVFGTETVDGQAVLAMKWIDGVPIGRWAHPTDAPRREVREVLEAFSVVCDAVHHAHQRGVIHRDLKPSNILVDKKNQPYVVDFGLAKLTTTLSDNDSRHSTIDNPMTLTGDFVGTPHYAPPEQLRGDHGAVDVRTDVYALGAVLFHALTGRMLFDGSLQLADLLDAVRTREPRAPSTINDRLDGEIDAIVLKAIAKDKELRYPSVDAFRSDVQRYLSGEAVLAHPPSATYRVRKFVRQHRAAVGGVLAFAILLVAATVVSTVLYFQGERERDRADEQLTESRRQQARAEKEARKAGQNSRFVTEMLARANRGEEKGNANVTVREALDAAASELETTQSNYEPEVEGAIRLTIGETYDGLGLSDLAEPHYRRAVELLQQVIGDESLRVAEAMQKLGSFYRRQARLQDAQAMLEGALRIRQEKIGDPNNPAIADARVSLAILKRQLGKFEEAETLYLQALEGYRASLGPDDENIGTVLRSLGVLNMYWERWDVAEQHLLDAQAFLERVPGDHEGQLIGIKRDLVHLLSKHGDPGNQEMLREVLAGQIRLHGPTHPEVARTYLALGAMLYVEGKKEEAVPLLRDAVLYIDPAILRSAIAAYTGYVFDGLGRGEEAEAFLREAMAQREASLGSANPLIAYFQFSIARICIEQQRFVEAEELLLPAWENLRDWTEMGAVEKKTMLERLVRLYEQWDAAEPGRGHAAQAEPWRQRLSELQD